MSKRYLKNGRNTCCLDKNTTNITIHIGNIFQFDSNLSDGLKPSTQLWTVFFRVHWLASVGKTSVHCLKSHFKHTVLKSEQFWNPLGRLFMGTLFCHFNTCTSQSHNRAIHKVHTILTINIYIYMYIHINIHVNIYTQKTQSVYHETWQKFGTSLKNGFYNRNIFFGTWLWRI